MQHPLDLGAAAHYFPADAFVDHRSHRYRSFMIEEILTDHTDAKGSSAPAGELLKFGVKALLSARPYHSPLGTSVGSSTHQAAALAEPTSSAAGGVTGGGEAAGHAEKIGAGGEGENTALESHPLLSWS